MLGQIRRIYQEWLRAPLGKMNLDPNTPSLQKRLLAAQKREARLILIV